MDDEPYLELTINWQSTHPPVGEDEIRRAVVSVLRAERCNRAVLSLAVVDDEAIAGLHRQHLDQPEPTDVLTFDLRDGEPDRHPGVDGEVIVSAETAARVAETLSHGQDAELLLYVVHGLLHLLGYDDKTAAAAEIMRARQHTLIEALGYTLSAEQAAS